MFASTENKGFQITFDNGNTVSCQFGATNYCDNYGRHLQSDYVYHEEMNKPIHRCENCEVAIWDKNGDWITMKVANALDLQCGDDVLSCITPAQIVGIMAYVKDMN